MVEVKESQVPLDGFRLDPPPPGPAPKISADDAVRRADASLGGAPDPGPEPTIALGLFSDDNGMIHMNPDGSETKLIQSRLTWVILYPHSIVGPGSGGPAGIAGQPTTTTTALPCYLGTVLIPVDATTGEVLFTQSNGEGVGH